MNRRQRKKRNKAQQLTIVIGCDRVCRAGEYIKMRKSIEYQLKQRRAAKIVIGCDRVCRAGEYIKMRKSIEYQLKAGSVILLPAYLHVEAIIQQDGSRRIEIKQESEAGA